MVAFPHNLDWRALSIEQIRTQKGKDGVSYLELFLNDYKRLFNVEKVNPSCSKCLTEYRNQILKKMKKLVTNSGFKIKGKYQGIAVKRFSNVMVSDANLTDDLAVELYLNRGAKVFEKLPPAEKLEQLTADFLDRRQQPTEEVVTEEVVTEEVVTEEVVTEEVVTEEVVTEEVVTEEVEKPTPSKKQPETKNRKKIERHVKKSS